MNGNQPEDGNVNTDAIDFIDLHGSDEDVSMVGHETVDAKT